MGFISDDDDDHSATPSEDHVSNWVCFPISSPSFIVEYPLTQITGTHFMETYPGVTGTAAALGEFFVVPALSWGLILECLLRAKRRQKSLISIGVIMWVAWLGNSLPGLNSVAQESESRLCLELFVKWMVLVTFALFLANRSWDRAPFANLPPTVPQNQSFT
jgi:hypothetical protein